MERKNSSLEDIAESLKTASSICVTGHYDPDGDTVGVVLAFGRVLEKLGKNVVMYNRDPVPADLAFLPGSSEIINRIPPGSYDRLLVCDCGELDRMGPVPDDVVVGDIINVDHHETNDYYGSLNLVEAGKSSVGELVFPLLKRLANGKIDAETATCLYCSIMADTGRFRYSNTTAETFLVASELVAFGANPDQVSRNVYEMYPRRRLELLGRVLSSLEFYSEGRLAVISLGLDDMIATGARKEDSEEFITHPRSVEGVEVAIFLKERDDGTVRISMRSNSSMDVAAVASAFEGGGHVKAAGCTIEGSLEHAKKQLVDKFETLMGGPLE